MIESKRGVGIFITWFNRIYFCFMDSGISEIYQDSTIVYFVFFLTLGDANCFRPTTISIHFRCTPPSTGSPFLFVNIDRQDFFIDPKITNKKHNAILCSVIDIGTIPAKFHSFLLVDIGPISKIFKKC